MNNDAILGCLLGTAVGDSIGLPYEGLSKNRLEQFLKSPLQQRLIFNCGMISDDTEHACFVAKALMQANGKVTVFERKLAWDLRWWLAGLPAGVGFATLKAIIKLWLAVPYASSGIFSAGNGAAMRSGLIGVVYANDKAQLIRFVYHSTRLTHRDPRAYFGALTVALATRSCALKTKTNAKDFVNDVLNILAGEIDSDYEQLLKEVQRSVDNNESLAQFTQTIGCSQGITGYVYHTVPCVIQCWLRHQGNYASGLQEIIQAGGDTDSTGAIYGAIAGTQVGKAGIPELWVQMICEYPRNVTYMEALSKKLTKAISQSAPQKPPKLFFPLILLRNLAFLGIILTHGFRRLFPPY